uniref:Coiled-coil domain-containing protein 25 n=1 Tax=Anser cygnoides TaxID=8845 RepID=A0A8B9DFZ8_ANSCY
MVFYFTSGAAPAVYTIYMGKDKYENEDLIKYGWPEDIWFHVDKLSSAHVYLRLHKGQTVEDIPKEVLIDCAHLVKANSIQGENADGGEEGERDPEPAREDQSGALPRPGCREGSPRQRGEEREESPDPRDEAEGEGRDEEEERAGRASVSDKSRCQHFSPALGDGHGSAVCLIVGPALLSAQLTCCSDVCMARWFPLSIQ